MSKKKTGNVHVIKWLKKGKELCSEHGETLISIVKSLNKRGTVDMLHSESGYEQMPYMEDKVNKTTDIKQYRAEIDADDSFNKSLEILEDAVSFIYNGGPINSEDVVEALRILCETAQDTIKYAVEQETKREEIRAMRDTAIARISTIRESIQTYLERTFDERSAIFAKQFDVVDTALKSGDNEMLVKSLDSINSLAASTPFKNLADFNRVQKSLVSSDTEWDI